MVFLKIRNKQVVEETGLGRAIFKTILRALESRALSLDRLPLECCPLSHLVEAKLKYEGFVGALICVV